MKTDEIIESMEVTGNVVIVLTNVNTGEKRTFKGKNLVTDAGDLHYAQEVVSETLTNAFGIMELGTAHGAAPTKTDDRADITTFVSSSQKVFDATYPKRNDGDTDNTGSGVDVVSYLVSYTTSEANDGAITEVIITNATPGASEPIQTHADVTSFAKTSSDTLKVFLNHTLNGV